jgi:hypothetical protein
MKKIFIILLVAVSFIFFSCKKETVSPKQENNPQTSTSTTAVTAKVNPSTDVFSTCFPWGVIAFSNNGVNQSDVFVGLNLIFCPDKTFTISNDLLAESGHWRFDVMPDNTVLLNLEFDSPDVSIETWRSLADVWKVIRLETTALTLQSTTTEGKTMNLQKWVR